MGSNQWRYGPVVLVLIILASSFHPGTNSRPVAGPDQDTTVVGWVNLHEMPGNIYLSRSMRYFLKIGADSSRFQCILHESKENKKLGMDLRLANGSMTWEQQMKELEKMMPVITKEFFPDSLTSISLGRLHQTGDACAEATRLYREKVTTSKKIPTYKLISQFLLFTTLTSRLNEVFAPYGLKVKSYNLEKVFFMPKNAIIANTRFEKAEKDIPDFLMDAIVWVSMERK